MAVEPEIFGVDLFGDTIRQTPSSILAKKYLFPPFSVLDAKQGDWQDRKRAWANLGIKGEMGRDARCYDIGHVSFYKSKIASIGVSIFDPTLCEIMYRWFCQPAGMIVDPFAGGSVRGIVASVLGYRYWGCDLRAEQIAANREQAADIGVHNIEWVCGDSMDELDNAPLADMLFSCPPYGDLEKYSDDPRDLSSMEWHTFAAEYGRIILKASTKLANNRFAVFVVGNFRDKRGTMRDLVGLTVKRFEECGMSLHNEAILLTAIGTAAWRASHQFPVSRKLCRVHQNVLVFCKGDPFTAARDIVDM